MVHVNVGKSGVVKRKKAEKIGKGKMKNVDVEDENVKGNTIGHFMFPYLMTISDVYRYSNMS